MCVFQKRKVIGTQSYKEKKMLTPRLLFQQYVEAGGGPIAVLEMGPTSLPLPN